MKFILIFYCCLGAASAGAQELFTYTEPASNMPVKSYAIRSNNYLSQEVAGNYFYATAPEFMLGISKKLMLHAETFLGNEPANFKFDGASLYVRYRFYSNDEFHSHFRMALTGKVAASNNMITQPALDLAGRNSGTEIGLVATKLDNRIALSGGVSFLSAFDNSNGHKISRAGGANNAFNYNISFGKLFLPVTYKDYRQVNVNVMLEFLGQTNAGSGNSFIDMAPSLQLIFLSKIRMDAGYRFPVVHSLQRTADRCFLFRVEYNFFNVFK